MHNAHLLKIAIIKIVTKTAQTSLFAGIALFAFCTSALADIDWKRMKRDLSIQESILDQFFDEKKVSTTGLYIENHGALLIASDGIHKYEVRVRAIGAKNVDISISDKSFLQRLKDRDNKSGENEEGILKKQEIRIEKKSVISKGQNEAIKKQVTEFLGIYGNAIGQLKDNDRITILLQLAKSDFQSFSFSHSNRQMEALKKMYEAHKKKMEEIQKKLMKENSKKQMANLEKTYETHKKLMEKTKTQIEEISKNIIFEKQAERMKTQMEKISKNIMFKIAKPEGFFFQATVTKRDIEAYNRGKVDELTFRDRITFREPEPEPVRDKTIDIMADILSNILKKNTDLHFLSDTKSLGFYQKGIGALFLVSQKGNLFGNDWYKQESDQGDGLDTFKTAIIETLADYGPTLRGLSPEESIIVHTNLIGGSNFKISHKDRTSGISKHPDRNRILFRVAKRDIDAYASQKIDLDTFKKRVAITEM